MKKKRYGTVLISMLLVGAVVGWMTFNSSTDPQPAVEYRAVCRNLPANAHWTSGGTRKEIPQTETSPNVWTPSPVGTYGTSTGDTACHFICDDGYGWNGTSCNVVKVRAACETQEIEFSGFKIAACNVGATVAGTGKLNGQDGCTTANNGTTCWSESLGDYFQRGNNYGFANSGTLATTSTKPNALGYGPGNPYSSGTFITASSDWSNSPNNNLRGGSSSDGPTTIPTNDAERQGPCPSGYHVPSMGERNQLLIARAGVNGVSLSDSSGYKYFSNETNAKKFRDDFLLPLAGYRYYDSSAMVYSQGDLSYYWSSSPNGSYARYLTLSTSDVVANYDHNRVYGFSLRCFKN